MIGKAAPRHIRILVDALAIITALALIVAGYALYERFTQTNERRIQQAELNERLRERDAEMERRFREADERQLEAIRTILCLARERADSASADAFYDEALRSVRARPCNSKE